MDELLSKVKANLSLCFLRISRTHSTVKLYCGVLLYYIKQ